MALVFNFDNCVQVGVVASATIALRRRRRCQLAVRPG
jgi:hypothetical protein